MCKIKFGQTPERSNPPGDGSGGFEEVVVVVSVQAHPRQLCRRLGLLDLDCPKTINKGQPVTVSRNYRIVLLVLDSGFHAQAFSEKNYRGPPRRACGSGFRGHAASGSNGLLPTLLPTGVGARSMQNKADRAHLPTSPHLGSTVTLCTENNARISRTPSSRFPGSVSSISENVGMWGAEREESYSCAGSLLPTFPGHVGSVGSMPTIQHLSRWMIAPHMARACPCRSHIATSPRELAPFRQT